MLITSYCQKGGDFDFFTILGNKKNGNKSFRPVAALIYNSVVRDKLRCHPLSEFSIVNCEFLIEFASIYASASFPEATFLLSSCYPLTILYLESSFFASFLHNDSFSVCILLQTAFLSRTSVFFLFVYNNLATVEYVDAALCRFARQFCAVKVVPLAVLVCRNSLDASSLVFWQLRECVCEIGSMRCP